MKKTLSMVALTSILSMIAAAQAGAVDVGCQFPTADDGAYPCFGTNNGSDYYAAAWDRYYGVTQPEYVADRRVARKPVYSAACDYNIAGGSGTPIFGKCTETGEEPAPVINADKAAEDHYNRTMQDISEAGGCNADNLPFSVAAHCWNWANHHYPMDAGISGMGGSD